MTGTSCFESPPDALVFSLLTETGKMADKSYTYFEVAEITEIGPGQRLYLEIDDHPVIIFNLDGKLYANDDECTHDNGPLGDGEIEGHCIACPRHGAKFDIKTGKAMTLPAVKNLRTYPVRVVGDIVEIGVILPE